MAETVVPFPVLAASNDPDHREMLAMAQELCAELRAGKINSLVLAMVSEEGVITRWYSSFGDHADLITACVALQHDLMAERD